LQAAVEQALFNHLAGAGNQRLLVVDQPLLGGTAVTEHTVPAVTQEATAEGAATVLPETAVALATKAKDLVALRDAILEAASVAAGLWFSYLFVLLYLIVAVGSITHRDLLFESPVRLPFLNVDLPLVGFFVIGPLIFIIVHAYVLLHFVLFAGKVGVFDRELREQIPDAEVRARLRRQLPSNLFVQFLAGAPEVRRGVMGLMLRLIAQITLVLGPIALLVFFQLQFLPYHNEAISWWQRIAVIVDIALLWMLWPAVARGESLNTAWRGIGPARLAVAASISIVPVLLLLSIATFPGEWLEKWSSVTEAPERKSWVDQPRRLLFDLRNVLVAGDVDFVGRKLKSLWSNRIVLPGFDAAAAGRESMSLRARHLSGAVLIDAALGKADLTAAELTGASLDRADLRNVKIGCAAEKEDCTRLAGASLREARLQGVSLVGADLAGASLVSAELAEADLSSADLRGARLNGANLSGAVLADAKLAGADLQGARLPGAALRGASLTGASLQSAILVAADLRDAHLEAADLDGAKLQGASLRQSNLTAASLRGAYLEGASFDEAELHGVSFAAAQLLATSFVGTIVWRADVRQAARRSGRFEALESEPKRYCIGSAKSHGRAIGCPWSTENFQDLQKEVEAAVVDPQRRDKAIGKIDGRVDPTKPLEEESSDAEAWSKLAASSLEPGAYERALSEEWRKLPCDRLPGLSGSVTRDGARYIVAGMIDRLGEVGAEQAAGVVQAWLSDVLCPAASGIPDILKTTLRKQYQPQ
jgi:uncharacterized protein YjbI with pentapeptide repeats